MAGAPEDLDTAEPLARRVARHAFDRLIMLSDGVFAIAVTLSALEIRAPTDGVGGLSALWSRMAEPLAAYAVSFAVVGVFWITDRRSLARIGRVDMPFTVMSLVFLALIALVPAGNRLLIEAHGVGSSGAFVAYLVLIALVSVVHAARWGYAAFAAGLVLPDVSRRFRVAHLLLTVATPAPSYVLLVGLATARSAPTAAAFAAGFAALTLGRRAVSRWAER